MPGALMPALGHTARRPTVPNRQLTASRAAKDAAKEAAVKKGYRFDPSYSRWVQDDRAAGKDSPVTITPKSGAAYTVWPVAHALLTEKKLESVKPPEAEKLQAAGWKVLDVRLPKEYNKGHVAGSVNVPMFRYVEGKSTYDNLKRLAMFAFAMKATERNPNFAEEVEALLGKNCKILLACDIGGTLSTKRPCLHKVKTYEVRDPERAFGRESRSLKAAYELYEAGFTKLKHMDLGVQQWRYEKFPMESE